MELIRVGISACLLGQQVRFDGGHKRDPFLTETLGPYVEWVPVCPEVEMGLGTPREPLRLVRDGSSTRMIATRTGIDHTDALNTWATKRLEELARADLDGYVLKSKSPSCGMERVKVFRLQAEDRSARGDRGLFAAALLTRLPLLPVEEEERLSDPRLRENFIERLFAYRRLKTLFTGRWTPAALVRFHTAHKMALIAHSPTAYRELGRLVANGRGLSRNRLRARYETGFMDALARPASSARHANALSYIAGQLKKLLDRASLGELTDCIGAYRRGLVPLVVPLTLLRHHAHVHGVPCLEGQTYLDPDPREQMLRNHI